MRVDYRVAVMSDVQAIAELILSPQEFITENK